MISFVVGVVIGSIIGITVMCLIYVNRQFIYEIGEAPCRACEVDDVKAELEEAPTIEAIPVSYLNEEIERCKKEGMEAEAYFLNEICRYWENRTERGREMTEEEKAICKKYSARDEEGKVHCNECPLVIDKMSYICKATEELEGRK